MSELTGRTRRDIDRITDGVAIQPAKHPRYRLSDFLIHFQDRQDNDEAAYEGNLKPRELRDFYAAMEAKDRLIERRGRLLSREDAILMFNRLLTACTHSFSDIPRLISSNCTPEVEQQLIRQLRYSQDKWASLMRLVIQTLETGGTLPEPAEVI